MSSKIKINKYDIQLLLLWFALFPIDIPGKIVYFIQAILAIIIFINAFGEIRKVPMFPLVCLFPLAIIVSCVTNRNTILLTQTLRGFIYALLIIDLYIFIHKYIRVRGDKELLHNLYAFSKVYFILSSAWILVLCITMRMTENLDQVYLVLGGKFNTAYLMLIFLILFYSSWNGNKILSRNWKSGIFFVLALFSIIICQIIHVSTGIVAISVFYILVVMPKEFLKSINNPILLVVIIVTSMVTVFFISFILKQPFIQNLIVNILHEDLSLTGRIELYKLLSPLLLKSGAWGGGFGSYVAAQLGYHGWYNAQNGLAEVILTYGYCGTIGFLLLCYVSSLKSKGYYKALNAGIFTFILIAIVEVPFDARFIFLLALFMLLEKKEV